MIFLGDLPQQQPSARWPVEDQTAALHEAAHACAALKARMVLHSVTLREVIALRGDATARGMAVYALAGAAMASRLGQPLSPEDYAVLKDAACEAGVDPWHPQWKVDAEHFVRQHNNDIKRLAVALLARRSMDGETVLAVLGDRWRPPASRPPLRLKP